MFGIYLINFIIFYCDYADTIVKPPDVTTNQQKDTWFKEDIDFWNRFLAKYLSKKLKKAKRNPWLSCVASILVDSFTQGLKNSTFRRCQQKPYLIKEG